MGDLGETARGAAAAFSLRENCQCTSRNRRRKDVLLVTLAGLKVAAVVHTVLVASNHIHLILSSVADFFISVALRESNKFSVGGD